MLTNQENRKLKKDGSKEFGIEQTTPATPQRVVSLYDNKHKEGTLIKYELRNEEFLCGNPFSKDTTIALEKLGEILKSIHSRLLSEGYEIVDGNIRKVVPQNVNVYEKA